MSDWVRRKFDWLDAVAAEIHEWLPVAVAWRLVGHYFNADSGEAWPSVDTLAADLGSDRRSVQRALKRLVDAGRLYNLGKIKGRKSNSYMMRGGSGVTGDTSPARATRRPRGGSGVAAGAGQVSPESENESERESERGASRLSRLRRDSLSAPSGVDSLAAAIRALGAAQSTRREEAPQAKHHRSQDGRRPSRRKSAITNTRGVALPPEWQLGNEEISVAQRIAGWDLPRSEQQFGKFRAWCRRKGRKSHDWPAEWESWCYNGADYEAKERKRPLTGRASALRGLGLPDDWDG